MTRNAIVANSILWAASIVAGALLHAPAMLTLVLLPSLAAVAWVVSLPASALCRRSA